MGIETKYEYIYYTVLQQDWFDEAERILSIELTTERLINAINRKLKDSKDWTLNNFKVDYSQHSEDIEYWIECNVRNKERPVFVKIENNQPIVKSGSGTLFVFYEEHDDDVNGSIPDYEILYEGFVDDPPALGGRL